MHLSFALAAASAALLPAGRRSLALLSEVCVDFWRHAGWFEVAFPQLASPGPAFARAPGLSLSAMRLLAWRPMWICASPCAH